MGFVDVIEERKRGECAGQKMWRMEGTKKKGLTDIMEESEWWEEGRDTDIEKERDFPGTSSQQATRNSPHGILPFFSISFSALATELICISLAAFVVFYGLEPASGNTFMVARELETSPEEAPHFSLPSINTGSARQSHWLRQHHWFLPGWTEPRPPESWSAGLLVLGLPLSVYVKVSVITFG